MASASRFQFVSAAAVLGALVGWACAAGTFTCVDDAACRFGAGEGVCQGDGYCSFPDDTCMSGQRYGEHAGDGKEHDCVAVDDGATSEGDDGGVTATMSVDDATVTTTGASSPVSASNATGESTGENTGGSTDDGNGDTDETTGAPTTGATDSSSGETTEGPPLDCSIDDEFDGPALDMTVWGSWGGDEGVTVVQTAGVVRFTIATGDTGIGGLVTVPAVGVAESMVTVTVGTPPDPSTTVEQSFIMQGSGGSVRVVLNDGLVQVIALEGASSSVTYSEPHDVQPGDRFRFTFSGGDVTVDMNLGGASWDELYSEPPPFDVDDVQVIARALSYEPLAEPSSVEVEAISVCAL
jgi:hypothetical protein